VWASIAVAVVLSTRALVYALAPNELQLAEELEQRAGGMQLAGTAFAVALIAAALAAAVLGVAVVAVNERIALEGRRLVAPPRLSPVRLFARTLLLFAATSFAFAMLESYIHWREGLGWHGLSCLLGPVHRDAIPILAGLSVLAVAIHGAVEYLLRWARRAFAALASRLGLVRLLARNRALPSCKRPFRPVAATSARGPPRSFVSVPAT
jgi:hypothetical protein